MTEPTTRHILACHLEACVADNDRGGIEGIAEDIAETALEWLRAHPEVAAGFWPDGVEIVVDGKWVYATSFEVIAKIRRLEGEARAARAEANQRIADADQRIKDLQAEFARQARVFERRIERAKAALDQPIQEQTT